MTQLSIEMQLLNNRNFFTHNMHPSVHYSVLAYPIQGHREPEAYPRGTGEKAGNNQNGLQSQYILHNIVNSNNMQPLEVLLCLGFIFSCPE